MKKVLIFGAAGFVGPYLMRELARHGYEVYGSDVAEQGSKGNPYMKADLLNKKQVETVVAQTAPDVIVNLAAISNVGQSWKIPQKTVEVNVVGTLNILESARKQYPMPEVMLIGSSEEYAESDIPISEKMPLDASNPYGISKMMQEKFAVMYRTQYGMQVYCVRTFNHTGIGQKEPFVIPSWCRQAAEISRSGKPGTMRVGNLEVKRDFSDVRDIVRAYRMILEGGDCKTAYNVGSGKAVALREILEQIISLSEQPIRIEVDPALIRKTDTPVTCCDRSLIEKKIGWKPQYQIFDTVRGMMLWQEGRYNEKENRFL